MTTENMLQIGNVHFARAEKRDGYELWHMTSDRRVHLRLYPTRSVLYHVDNPRLRVEVSKHENEQRAVTFGDIEKGLVLFG